jgi:hypothetical protein
MVGGQREHDCLGIARPRDHRGRRNGRRRVAPHRLEHDSHLDADLLGLAACEKSKILRCHDDRRREQLLIGDPLQCLLVGGMDPHQRQELLGHRIARYGP